MNKRDVFLPSISTLTILGMMVFYSCAHQSRVEDELDASTDEEASLETVDSEVKDTGSEVAGATNEATDTASTASNDLDMSELGVDTTVDTATQAAGDVKEGAEAAATTATEGLGSDDLSMMGMDGAPATDAAAEGTSTLADTGTAVTDLPAGSDPLENLEGSGMDSAVDDKSKKVSSKPIVDDPVFSKSTTPRKSFAGGSLKVPKIPSKPKMKNGKALNRFYFVRKGDTAESISQMIYGSESRAADLKKWNSGSSWRPGQIVYYSSPLNPSDTQIGSFYRENGVESEEYTVEKGDWISKIAYKKLGSPDSWKEIAVINGMSRPGKIEVGQRIAIYSKDLSKFGGEEATASAMPVKPAEIPSQIAEVPPQIPSQIETPPASDVQNAANEPPPVVDAPPPVKAKQAVDGSKLVEQNLPAAFILAGVLILSAAYLAVRRRKMAKQQTEEFDEMPSSKSNRK